MEATEGIVLKSLDYKENQRIITVFSKDFGVISLIVKGVSRSSLQKLAITTPLCQAEFHFTRGKSDLFRLSECAVVCDHLPLRNQLSHLQAAGVMAQAILKFQLPCKPTPLLYALFERYLKQLPGFPNPLPLTSSFLLKMLHLEGLLSLERPLPHFTSSEQDLLTTLVESRSFTKVGQQPVTPSFAQKVYDHFTRCMEH
ncbi:MAG: DNA repair protein RecO [Chlamydiales bacterium]